MTEAKPSIERCWKCFNFPITLCMLWPDESMTFNTKILIAEVNVYSWHWLKRNDFSVTHKMLEINKNKKWEKQKFNLINSVWQRTPAAFPLILATQQNRIIKFSTANTTNDDVNDKWTIIETRGKKGAFCPFFRIDKFQIIWATNFSLVNVFFYRWFLLLLLLLVSVWCSDDIFFNLNFLYAIRHFKESIQFYLFIRSFSHLLNAVYRI